MSSRARPVVFLVDDEPDVVASLRRTLGNETYRLVECLEPLLALRLRAHEDVAVIISDVDMPGMSGLELMQRARTVCPSAIRIMLSGSCSPAAADAVGEGIVHRFIHKPFLPAIMRTIVAEAVDQWLRAREADAAPEK